jgi:hypothetical protein
MHSAQPSDEREVLANQKDQPMKAKVSGGLKAPALLVTLAGAWPLNARAEMLWNWSYLDPDTKITAAGTLTTKDRAADSYLITAVTGLWNGAAITGLEAPHSCCSPPGWNTNLLLDGKPWLDKGGFAFSVSGNLKINLFYKEGRFAYEVQNGYEVFGGVFDAAPSGTK